MKVVKILVVTLIVPALVSLALACGGGTNDTNEPDDGHIDKETTLMVGLQEWDVVTHESKVPAGDVTFTVSNHHGTQLHELVILKTDVPADELEVHDGTAHEGDYEVIGKVQNIAPGQTKSATFHLEDGTYVLLCNIPGHYQAGMYTILAVGEGHHPEK